jgi:hypothetical protein
MKSFWDKEPLILSLLGSGTVWLGLFGVCAAFGHPLTSSQQTALLGLLGAVGAAVGRSQVTPTSGATAPPSVDVSKLSKQ